MGKVNDKKKKVLIALIAVCLLRKSRRRKAQSVWVRSWLARRQHLGMSATLVTELRSEDTTEYRSMFRMDKGSFDELLSIIQFRIQKEDTLLRQCIPAEERLQVTLRYLATG